MSVTRTQRWEETHVEPHGVTLKSAWTPSKDEVKSTLPILPSQAGVGVRTRLCCFSNSHRRESGISTEQHADCCPVVFN